MKSKKTLILEVQLTDDFYKRIHDTMLEELSEAQNKWRVKLDNDTQDLIMRHAQNQLQSKSSAMAKPWHFGDPKINISVVHPRTRKVKLPDDEKELEGVRLERPKSLWEVAENGSENAVDIEDFVETIEDLLVGWARTAVFYGVGSEA